jgi:multiple sugar transport system ATP-binding protein
VRPQDCRVAGDTGPAIAAEVLVVEDLLEFTLITLAVAGRDEPVVVQLPPDAPYRPGDSIRFTADPARVYLFDTETGERIR